LVPPHSTPAGGPARTPDAAQPTRRDARRNREKLIAAAQAVFAAADGPVSLESVARRAGVGIGTLYRHFPTREALVDAVYASELDAVAASVGHLLDRLPADAALRAWMDRYATFVATKRGMSDTLRAGFASGRIAPPTRERVTTAVAAILERGAEEGSLRADVDPEDVTTMLLGVFFATAPDGLPGAAARPLDLIVDALRPRTGPTGESGRPE
jgi:AcrR family transcriptional regulator